MLVVSAAVIGCPKKEMNTIINFLNPWAAASGVELSLDYYPSGVEFLSSNKSKYHITFIDISSEREADGLSAARAIRDACQIQPIALLADNDTQVRVGYEIGVVAYITRPFRQAALEQCMGNIFTGFSDADFTLNCDECTFSVPYNGIRYIQGIENKALIALNEGSFKPTLRMDDLDNMLPRQFIWCAKHTILNVRYIQQIHKNKALLLNNEILEIEPEYRTKVITAYLNRPS